MGSYSLSRKVLLDRFEVQDKIGEGRSSYVYEARDLTDGRAVALKLMKSSIVSKDLRDIASFRNEAEAFMFLRHPGIVDIYGAGDFEGAPFLIMERVCGRSMQEALDKEDRMDVLKCLGIMKDVAGTLAYIHSRGILHRDLKPSNIILVKEGNFRTKIIDMAFACAIDWNKSRKVSESAGSFSYISPEGAGILKRNIDERSDLYSLGVTFYYMLTGELPFSAEDVPSLIHKHAAFIPPPPSKIRGGIPYAADRIVMKLMEKDPDKRYKNAVELMEDLSHVSPFDDAAGNRVYQRTNINSTAYMTDLFGREEEMGRLREMYSEASVGRGCVCFISGEAGIGKSRAAGEMGKLAREKGGMFISGRCLEFSSKIPYQPFKDALEKALDYYENLDDEHRKAEVLRISRIMGDTADAVAAFSPIIKRLLGSGYGSNKIKFSEDERMMKRFLASVSKLFISMAPPGKACLLLLDDIQWADTGSIYLLEEIMKIVHDSNLMVLCTVRDDEVGCGHPLYHYITDNDKRGQEAYLLKLEPLSIDGLNSLTAGLLCESKKTTLELSCHLLRNTGGNPFFAINMLRELLDAGGIRIGASGIELEKDTLKDLSMPMKLKEAVLNRLRRVTEPQMGILSIAAVAGGQIEAGLIKNAIGKELGISLETEIKNLLKYRIIDTSGRDSNVVMIHDSVREAVMGIMGDNQRKGIHLKLAEVLEDKYNRDNDDDTLFRLVYHYMEGEQYGKAMKYALPAADAAAGSFANEEAVRLYSFVLGHSCENVGQSCQDRYSLLIKLMNVYVLMGRNESAISLSEQCLNMADDNLKKARVYKLKGRAYFKKGDWKSCEESLYKALHFLGEKYVFLHEYSKFMLAEEVLSVILGMAGFGLISHFKKDGLHEKYGEIIDIYYTIMWILALKDRSKLLYYSLRSINISIWRFGKSRELAAGYNIIASTLMTAGFYGISEKIQKRGLYMRRSLGDRWGEAQSLQHLAYVLSWKGDQKSSIEYFKKSEEIFKGIGDTWELGKVLGGLGRSLCLIGDYPEAARVFEGYSSLSSSLGDTYGSIGSNNGLGYIHLEMGEMDKARSILQKSVKESHEMGMDFLLCTALIHLGQLELETGNCDGALDYLKQAIDMDKRGRFLKFYTAMAYPYYAEAAVKKMYMEGGTKDGALLRQDMEGLYRLCTEAQKETKHLNAYHGASLRCLGLYYALSGKTGKAEKYFIRSIAFSQRYGRRYDAAKSMYEYSRFLKKEGRAREAGERRAEACNEFKEIESSYYVRKISEEDSIPESPNEGKNTSLEKLNIDRRYNMILEAGEAISSVLNMESLLDKILECSIKLSGAERGAILLYSEGGSLELRRCSSINMNKPDDNVFAVSQSIISQALDKGKYIIVADAMGEEDLSGRDSVVLNRLRSVMCMPIKSGNKVHGVIYLDNRYMGNLFDGDDVESIRLLAGQAAVSIQNAVLYGRTLEYAAELERSRDRVSELNRELERRVEERTSELRQTMDELVRTQEHLLNTSKMASLGNLMSRIAHEINTPVGNSLTASSHLKRKTGELQGLYKDGELSRQQFEGYLQKSEETLSIVVNNLVRASDIVKSFKRVSVDLDAGSRRAFNLNEYIHDILRGLLPSLEKSGHDVEVSCGSDIIVTSYPGALSQVITNLVLNCIVHAFDNGARGRIEIKAGIQGEKMELIVSDNGRGMDPATKEKIFEPFFTTRGSEGSTGLGLNIVYNIVTRTLRGAIRCESSPGRGSQFIIYIPLEEIKNDR